MEPARHVFRVALLLLLAGVTFVIGRSFLVPRTYGEHGPYRYDNVTEQRAVRAPRHAGAAACGACHAERLAAVSAGAHRAVSCEVCHAPLTVHASDGDKRAPMPVDRSGAACARCHRRIDGRPAAFPQIVLAQHQGGVERTPCLECHDPHSPKL
jgi:Class III cytochrome C family